MNRLILTNITLYPNARKKLENGQLIIEDGKIAGFSRKTELTGKIIDGQGLACLPGYIDAHVHGGYGFDFLRQPEQALQAFEQQVAKEGTTGYLASFVSGTQSSYLNALKDYRNLTDTLCLGVHLEGPFLSRHYMAVMDPSTVREPNLAEFQEMVKAGNGSVKQVTIAPETKGALELVEWGAQQNISMMLGHSDARMKDVKAAIEHGAFGTTHLYNAMSPHSHRDPGLVSGALYYDSLINEIISDGFHVNPQVVAITFNAIGADRLALVTDATLMRGLPDGQYHFSSYDVNKAGIHATVKETGRIAGSVVGMDEVVRKCHEFTGCDLNQIVQMASVNPARIARCADRKGKLEHGYDADFILLDDRLQVQATYSRGVRKF